MLKQVGDQHEATSQLLLKKSCPAGLEQGAMALVGTIPAQLLQQFGAEANLDNIREHAALEDLGLATADQGFVYFLIKAVCRMS